VAQRTWSKSEIVEVVAAEVDLTKVAAGEAVDAVLDTITNALKARGRVQLTGFGTFETRERKARTGRNPRTGAAIYIPAQTVPVFKAGKALKDAVR